MVSLCFYFQVHQPYRIRKYSVFDIGNKKDYFEDRSGTKLDNKWIVDKVAGKCYLPTNAVLLELLKKHPEFKISFSLSGVFLEQLEEFAPDVLKSFQDLVETGQVEILSETYYHSLSFLYDKEEFRAQVELHRDLVKRLFGAQPTVFRNTELIYNNELAGEIEAMGYKGVIAEGADHLLGWRSPNFLYKPVGTERIKVLLKNYKLSDDVAFRFSNRGWKDWPLTVPKYVQWLNSINGSGEVINLFMDYETFGEHQWEDTGIFEFLRHLPEEFLKHPDNNFKTPSEVVDAYPTRGEYDAHSFISWADLERDLSAWKGNEIQDAAMDRIYDIGERVKLTGNDKLIHRWRKLQTSDHFYYMCTKWFSDGDVHKYFNPYESPYEAFIAYMNVLQDLEMEVNDILKERGFVKDGILVEPRINL
ncbi:polysaccharide deacetylase family protein [Candidatus Peregrinibacteria bacterium]|jgi:alpha-amylase|nr:polysaccharide deacetylase family protein [Candidatus Peregrinibacteria bacterium]